MSIARRLAMIFKSKANKALDKHEDPRETLDYSYQKQLEMLQKVRRGVADVATSRKRLELQMQKIQQSIDTKQKQAAQAVSAGRDDLAREALTQKSGAQEELKSLTQQHDQLQGEEERLVQSQQRLQTKVETFRTKKETIKASYTAAEAQTKIGEAFGGISEEMGDVGMAMDRAQTKVENMQARAGAVDELLDSGALNSPLEGPKDDIQAELDRMSSDSDVDTELAKLKGELPSGGSQQAIGGSSGDSDDATSQPEQGGSS
jgi:phage shock protein A